MNPIQESFRVEVLDSNYSSKELLRIFGTSHARLNRFMDQEELRPEDFKRWEGRWRKLPVPTPDQKLIGRYNVPGLVAILGLGRKQVRRLVHAGVLTPAQRQKLQPMVRRTVEPNAPGAYSGLTT